MKRSYLPIIALAVAFSFWIPVILGAIWSKRSWVDLYCVAGILVILAGGVELMWPGVGMSGLLVIHVCLWFWCIAAVVYMRFFQRK